MPVSPGPDVIKIMLNSGEHGVLNVYKYKNILKNRIFQAQVSLECFFLLINGKVSIVLSVVKGLNTNIMNKTCPRTG